MTKKLLALTLTLVLAAGVAAVAQTTEKMDLDVGVSVLESNLTLRTDYKLAYLEIPFQENMDTFGFGVKTPDLAFDVYGTAGVIMERTDTDNFLSGWQPGWIPIQAGIGKRISLGDFGVRVEGMVGLTQKTKTKYGGKLILQYRF